MFLRFVRSNPQEGMAAREGFFCAAYQLRDDVELDQYTSQRLEDLLSWFRENLDIPNKFSKSKSKGSWRRKTKGLSWFKSSAKETLAKSFELVALLEENGYGIELIRSERVGYIVFEDDNQVVAEPFGDTTV